MVSVAPEPGVTRPERHGGSDMGWVINCDCGTAIRGQTGDEIVENAQDHAKASTR